MIIVVTFVSGMLYYSMNSKFRLNSYMILRVLIF